MVKDMLLAQEVWGSNSVLVKLDTVSPTVRHRCDDSLELCRPGAKPWRWTPPFSARVVKTLKGDGTTFHAEVKRDGHYTCKGMVYAKMFNGRDGVVLRGDGIPCIPPQLEHCRHSSDALTPYRKYNEDLNFDFDKKIIWYK